MDNPPKINPVPGTIVIEHTFPLATLGTNRYTLSTLFTLHTATNTTTVQHQLLENWHTAQNNLLCTGTLLECIHHMARLTAYYMAKDPVSYYITFYTKPT
jgi:hypothetical protein